MAASCCASRTATLKLDEQRRFLAANAASIDAFKARQQAAFEAERERWQQSGAAAVESDAVATTVAAPEAAQVPEGCAAIDAPVTGSVWHVNVVVWSARESRRHTGRRSRR